MPKILLLDGHNLLYRGFYALPLLTSPNGEYTNGIMGFLNFFLKVTDQEKPDKIAVAFDLHGPTFRHEKYKDYKGTRKPMPVELRPQVPLLMELLEVMNIPIVTCPGYEADDVLGSLAVKARDLGYSSVIVSGDRDLLQLAGDAIKIRMPISKKTGKPKIEDYQAEDVLEKYGVTPKAYIDVKALMGDPSDNIPGVPGIGEKTAFKLITAYGSIENAIAHASEITPKNVGTKLINFAVQAVFSKELVTIALDAPVDFDFEGDFDTDKIWNDKSIELLRRLNFRTILARFKIPNEVNEANPDLPAEFELACYVLNEPKTTNLTLEEILAEIEKNGQSYLYNEIELPLSEVLRNMEGYGIKVDKESLIKYGQSLDSQIDILTGEIYELSGKTFNINSPAQLSVVLFEDLGLKGTKKTKSGYSTAADVLESIKNSHPVIPKILSYRTYAKLKSTYVDGLLPLIDPADSRIRSTFNQTLTTTGRISSSEPNLQNIPIRMPLGRELRKVFVPEEGCIFIDADYSQIELRVLAHMSEDQALIEAFHQNRDIHQLTAAQVFKVPPEMVQPFQRHAAKAVNFGIIYGISAFGLAQDLNITRKEAQMYIDSYFRQYPGVKKFMDKIVEAAKSQGYAETIFNRRRPIKELTSSNYATRSFGERAAMNMPIQGTAADIIKIAMVRTTKRLKKEGLSSRLILQVHDELLLEVKESETDTVRTLLKEEMEGAAELAVPLEIEIHEGANWYDVK